MYQPAPTPHRTPTPWYRRTWILVVVTAFLALGVGAAAAGGNKTEATADPVPATVTATTTAPAPAPPARTVTLRPTVVRTVATRTRTRTETYTPPPQPTFGDGTYEVGLDIRSGTFRTDGGECYYAILRDISTGDIEDIVENDNISGPAIVKLRKGQYFETSGGCEWHRA